MTETEPDRHLNRRRGQVAVVLIAVLAAIVAIVTAAAALLALVFYTAS